MKFDLNDEQISVRDACRRFLEDECAFEKRAAVVQAGAFDPAHWRAFADMGWFGMMLPACAGGYGGPIEAAIVMEEVGRTLCVEPIFAIGVLAAQTLAALGGDLKAQQLLAQLIAGEARPVLAHNEPDARGAVAHVGTRAQVLGAGQWVLHGVKSLVVAGNVADSFLVSARTSGESDDRDGITLFRVAADSPGLTRRDIRLVDNRWCAHLVFDGVKVGEGDVLGVVGDGYAALDSAHAHALVGACAEAVGVMDKALWITRDYLQVRKQFGAPLSSFQALQHRMSDMLVELELARGMVFRALSRLDASVPERDQALSAAKVRVDRSGRFICGQAIQLHGGIGVTEEYIIGHYFKRMTLIEQALGNTHFHLDRLAAIERSIAPVCEGELIYIKN